MIDSRVREPLERMFCCCIGDNNGLYDDGKPVSVPTRVGLSILFYGKRKSAFPYHCMVGPDWPFVALVFFLIISINIAVLYVISPIGWIPVFIGLVGAIALLCSYSATVFSDPGIVYKNDFVSQTDPMDMEANRNTKSSLETPIMPNTSTIMPSVPHTIECGQCDLRRPFTARHCEYCKLCIDNLDHHCPWYVIVRDLVFHISFLIYSFIFPLFFYILA